MSVVYFTSICQYGCAHIYQFTCYLLFVCIVVYVHTCWVVKFVLFVREPCNPCSNETDILRIVVVHTDRIWYEKQKILCVTNIQRLKNRMHCKMVFNFTVRHDQAVKRCQTRWPLIGLRNLILIGQLRIWWKQTKAFVHTLTAVNNLSTECYVIPSRICKLK